MKMFVFNLKNKRAEKDSIRGHIAVSARNAKHMEQGNYNLIKKYYIYACGGGWVCHGVCV